MRGTGLLLPRTHVGVSRWRRFRAAVDWPLIIVIVALCALGLLNLYSATRGVRHHAKFDHQIQWMIIGSIGFVIATVIDYRTLVRLAWAGLGVSVLLLLVARMFGAPAPGETNHGITYRWLNIGRLGIQPSELVKLMVILALGRIFRDAEPASYTPRVLLARLATLGVPIVLIAIQPDLGTATLIALIVLSVGFLAMPSIWPMVLLVLGALLAIPVLWETMHDYQQKRILGFIDCGATSTKDCWHTQQSIYAVGSGRLWGKGFLEGTQNQFNFVPEHWTDFPYSVWAEEWGFVGSVVMIAIFGFLLVWILNVALSARDRIGAVICVGVAAMTFWHVVVNIGMVLGVAPVVGVTLPFISYGGSSLCTFFLAMGLVANVSLRKHGY